MSDQSPPAPVLPKKRRTGRIIAVVVIIGLTLAGFLGYVIYQGLQCDTLVGCPPYPTLSIQSGNAQVESFAATLCQTTQLTAVCPIYIVGGNSGDVTLNVALQGVRPGAYEGGIEVAFLVYSSAASYVNFTSIPDCAFTSGPSLNARGCNVPSNGSAEFRFNFTVSSSYNESNQRWPDSVTVHMWQTCCLP
jgi:hypothetical protein